MKASKKAPNKPPKFAIALIPFSKVDEAHAAVCAAGLELRGLKDMEITWASGQAPTIIEALKRKPQAQPETPSDGPHISAADLSFTTSHHTPAPPTSGSSSTPSFSFDPFEVPQTPNAPTASGLDYESITLMRLRQAERERLEREIREQDL
ncbi:hypothetical protein M422DRAFT_51125 [Sphaerobolus stellatus SS14]|uniref:Unplaced genomic scaffold SPHSTscaffold_104, whole genome shotgun sequence n=1 Tax=Sphaerobolus stellatus (strain SS14) TaxID=990650 RepID=A0A0C9UNE5_SPHS4|nr:hypothetical protein M422DRAFT_51125 [Sphaerobolus stellatus SS14]